MPARRRASNNEKCDGTPPRGRMRGESGAALVEFALILPVFAMLVFGVFSAGQAYNNKLTVVHAVREGARYGAALPQSQCTPTSSCSGKTWAQSVQAVVAQRSNGALTASQVCVALVAGAPAAVVGGSAQSSFTTSADGSSPCLNDGLTDTGTRVQVSAQRTGDRITAVLFNIPVTESSSATARFEQ
jgi:Flp pilus assembly protein TadG